MKYLNYRASDFAADESFIQWVLQPTEEMEAEWTAYLQEHPWQSDAVKEAREMVLHLSYDFAPAAEADLEDVWQKLTIARRQDMAPVELTTSLAGKVIPISGPNFRLFWAAAAAAILLVSGYFLTQQKSETVTYATAAGERLRLRLPDSSFVVLNENSELELPTNWRPDQDRVVQLEGQAFFTVIHKHNHQKFVVETANGLEIEVLGTEFSVSDNGVLKQVILENGSVSLSMGQRGKEQKVRMVPGELVDARDARHLVKKRVQPELYNAWKSQSLVLENKTLEEVAQLLHYSYGYTVDIVDTKLKEQRITASLDNNTPEHILSTLSETLEVNVQKQNKNIIISSN